MEPDQLLFHRTDVRTWTVAVDQGSHPIHQAQPATADPYVFVVRLTVRVPEDAKMTDLRGTCIRTLQVKIRIIRPAPVAFLVANARGRSSGSLDWCATLLRSDTDPGRPLGLSWPVKCCGSSSEY